MYMVRRAVNTKIHGMVTQSLREKLKPWPLVVRVFCIVLRRHHFRFYFLPYFFVCLSHVPSPNLRNHVCPPKYSEVLCPCPHLLVLVEKGDFMAQRRSKETATISLEGRDLSPYFILSAYQVLEPENQLLRNVKNVLYWI